MASLYRWHRKVLWLVACEGMDLLAATLVPHTLYAYTPHLAGAFVQSQHFQSSVRASRAAPRHGSLLQIASNAAHASIDLALHSAGHKHVDGLAAPPWAEKAPGQQDNDPAPSWRGR